MQSFVVSDDNIMHIIQNNLVCWRVHVLMKSCSKLYNVWQRIIGPIYFVLLLAHSYERGPRQRLVDAARMNAA